MSITPSCLIKKTIPIGYRQFITRYFSQYFYHMTRFFSIQMGVAIRNFG